MEMTTTPMSNDEIVDTLKTMVFGAQTFERFNAKERQTLDKAWNIIDQYETRLKADMVAMLEEISLEIEEKTKDPALDDYDCGFNTGVYVSRDIIQQKIDKLKEAKDGENNN